MKTTCLLSSFKLKILQKKVKDGKRMCSFLDVTIDLQGVLAVKH